MHCSSTLYSDFHNLVFKTSQKKGTYKLRKPSYVYFAFLVVVIVYRSRVGVVYGSRVDIVYQSRVDIVYRSRVDIYMFV